MSDALYEQDVLAWSEQQADLLRRLARGERVNDIDWAHVAEEIEDLGLSELNAVQSYLRQMLVHLLKLRGWPELGAERHWRAEIVAFQADASQRFSPSMRRRIALDEVYGRAVRQIDVTAYDGISAQYSPETCPVTLDQLLNVSCAELEAAFREADPGGA